VANFSVGGVLPEGRVEEADSEGPDLIEGLFSLFGPVGSVKGAIRGF